MNCHDIGMANFTFQGSAAAFREPSRCSELRAFQFCNQCCVQTVSVRTCDVLGPVFFWIWWNPGGFFSAAALERLIWGKAERWILALNLLFGEMEIGFIGFGGQFQGHQWPGILHCNQLNSLGTSLHELPPEAGVGLPMTARYAPTRGVSLKKVAELDSFPFLDMRGCFLFRCFGHCPQQLSARIGPAHFIFHVLLMSKFPGLQCS